MLRKSSLIALLTLLAFILLFTACGVESGDGDVTSGTNVLRFGDPFENTTWFGTGPGGIKVKLNFKDSVWTLDEFSVEDNTFDVVSEGNTYDIIGDSNLDGGFYSPSGKSNGGKTIALFGLVSGAEITANVPANGTTLYYTNKKGVSLTFTYRQSLLEGSGGVLPK